MNILWFFECILFIVWLILHVKANKPLLLLLWIWAIGFTDFTDLLRYKSYFIPLIELSIDLPTPLSCLRYKNKEDYVLINEIRSMNPLQILYLVIFNKVVLNKKNIETEY